MGFFSKKKSDFLVGMIEKYNPIHTAEHIILRNKGLPPVISKYTYFDFLLCKDKIVILCDPYEIVIMKEDLNDIHYEFFDKGRVTNVSNGSLVGSMVGESMFGTPGAIMGATPRIQSSKGESGINMIIRYRSKDNIIKTLFFQYVSGSGGFKDFSHVGNLCKEAYKELLSVNDIQGGQIIL